MRFVLDASAVVDVLAATDRAAHVRRHLAGADELVAPDLLFPEVTSALWRLVRRDELSAAEAETGLRQLEVLPVDVVPGRRLVPAAWSLRTSVRISDAFYLACADVAQAPLLTSDARLGRGHHGIAVVVCATA